MAKRKKKIGERDSFILYYDSRILIDKLSDEDAGKVFKKIFSFRIDGVEPEEGELSLAADIAFSSIQNYLIRDDEAYKAKCLANQQHALEEWQKRNGYANAYDCMETLADSDPENVLDPESVPVPDSVSDFQRINGSETKPCSKLDFNNFSKVISKAYENSRTSYTLEDCLDIFKYYFDSYRKYTGRDHPALSQDTVTDIIFRLEYAEGEEEGQFMVLNPSDYKSLIDSYFQTDFPNCDRNICHFMSGKVRYYRIENGV